MTKKDFELIAAVIRGRIGVVGLTSDHAERGCQHDVLCDIAADFANILGGTNPAFDPARFLRAALGPPPEPQAVGLADVLPTQLADVESPSS